MDIVEEEEHWLEEKGSRPTFVTIISIDFWIQIWVLLKYVSRVLRKKPQAKASFSSTQTRSRPIFDVAQKVINIGLGGAKIALA